MINYRRLCEEFEKNPGFSNVKKSRVLLILSMNEILEQEKKETVYYADNDLWQEYWIAIKKEIIMYGIDQKYEMRPDYFPYDTAVGCRKLLSRLGHVKAMIFTKNK